MRQVRQRLESGVVKSAELNDRWGQREGRATVAAARAWLAGDGPQPEQLGHIDGRVDLRGIPLTGALLTLGDNHDPSRGVSWESLDFSHAQMDGLRLFGGRIHDCLFDAASLVDLRVWGTTVAGCSFRRADISNAGLGPGEWHGLRTTWRDTVFDRAKLHRAVFTGSSLHRCSFDTPGKLLQLQDCEIIDCTFSGILDSVIIDGRGHKYPVAPGAFSADFTRSTFRNAHITGYCIDPATLPEQADLVLIRNYPHTLNQAATWLQSHGATQHDGRAAAFLQRLAAAPGPNENLDTAFDLGGFRDPGLSDAVQRALQQIPA